MIKYTQSQNPADCCGCRACEQICGHKALTFATDKEGFLYPVLDVGKCMDCGLCEKVCPMMCPSGVLHEEGEAYAAQYLNVDDLKTSSSGGGFIAIAKHVINNDGVVYGATYQNGPWVAHERVDNLSGVEKLKGSKYVQSDTHDVFSMIKEDLKTGKIVYFTGTPCQVAGLRLFLRKDYANLITSDLICHGTPSPKVFANTVSHIEEKIDADFCDYSFRDKRIRGWSCSSSSSYKSRNKGTSLYLKYSIDMEAYFNAFISGHLMRMNCYHCPFAQRRRCGDITLADFWGVRKRMPDFPNIHKGVSLLIANSAKGKALIEKIKGDFYIKPIPMDMAVETNANLRQPTPYSDERRHSYSLAYGNYDAFVRKYNHGNHLMNELKVNVEYFIRKNPWIFSLLSKAKRLMK